MPDCSQAQPPWGWRTFLTGVRVRALRPYRLAVVVLEVWLLPTTATPHHHHHHSTSFVAASKSMCNTNALFPRLESFSGITTIDVSSKTSPTIVGSLPLLGARAGVLLPGGTHMAVTLFSQDKLCSVRAMGNSTSDGFSLLWVCFGPRAA
jgi:hypothetical protein